MFPPVRTENLHEAIKGLIESLNGCTDYLTGSGSVEEQDKSKILVKMALTNNPTEAARRHLKEYIRLYFRDCGWTVRGATIEYGVLMLKLTPRK